MITLVHDPVGLSEFAAILLCLVFYGWWFSPRQRYKRRRDEARDRTQLRRASTASIDTTDAGSPAPPAPHDQRAEL